MCLTSSVGKKYTKIAIILTAICGTSLIVHSLSNGGHNHTVDAGDTVGARLADNELVAIGGAVDPQLVFAADEMGRNATGYDREIVPNVVHYVVLDNMYINFVHFLSIKSVLRNQRPDQIVIHCNCDDLRGRYWTQLLTDAPRVIRVRRLPKPTAIFGKKLSSIYHSADIARLQVMTSFGGIYLDNDVFVVKSLDPFRRFEFTIGWPPGQFIGNQVLIGHKNARFSHLWYESYRKYRKNRWYFNAGELPTNDILLPKPWLVHRVDHAFGVHNLCLMLYNQTYPLWEKDYFAVHLLARHRDYLVPQDFKHLKMFDENNIKTYNKTFGQMARLVLYGTKHLIDNTIG
ncbi:unnamed protein product [Medioppia subpectinata]|uniref:Glycosyltransferase n=1 Tax=Medioppia subpectinata TaxID=1979941 RepID=A0A7R9L4H8_9ACAR|nr:unnamed protein product [Medioppia subpectinata]CAG2115186.1 unnamed protein product [Medioppia subpectinata]